MESMSLLNMLAEIASEKLQTDPTVRMISKSEETKSIVQTVNSEDCQQNQGKQMTLQQVSSISENSVLRLFTVSQANELKRKFYYTCRLLPHACEETFQSFGSEEKARNLMKKHLKHHLNNLLNEFEDAESREKYILRAVSTAQLSSSDAKTNNRKTKKKLDTKSKVNYEKENSKLFLRKLETPQTASETTYNYNISSSSADSLLQSASQQQHLPVLNDDKQIYSQNFMLVTNQSSITSEKPTSTTLAIDYNQLQMVNDDHKGLSEMQVNNSTYHPEGPKPTYVTTYEGNMVHSNEFNMYTSSSNDVAVHANSSRNGIVYLTPSSQYMNVSSAVYSGSVNGSSEFPKRKVEGIPVLTVNQVPTKKTRTEIIDIRVEENVKMEALSSDQHLSESNGLMAQDHGCTEIESGFGSRQAVMKREDVRVEQELMDIWNDFTNGSIFIENAEPATQSEERENPSITIESIDSVSVNPGEERQEEVAEISENKKNSRFKGKGKFIGQGKNERQMALNLIEKIKSNPSVQLESLECTICNPPRTFTAAATLLSHYKSHAGIRPYVCVHCGAVFTRQHSLNYHYLIHLNQTRFTCNDCGRKFRHPSHFKEHRRRHTGESPYECMDCFMRFKTRNTYKRHLRTRHGKKLTTEGSIHTVAEGTPDDLGEKVASEIQKDGGGAQDTFNLSDGKMSEEKGMNNFLVADHSQTIHDVKWSNVISLDANDGRKIHGLANENKDTDRYRYNEANVSTTTTTSYHEMLPLEVSDLNSVHISNESNFPLVYKNNTDGLYNQMFRESTTVLPTATTAVPGTAVEHQQLPNVLRINNELEYIDECESVSFKEPSHNSSSELKHYNTVESFNYSNVNTSSNMLISVNLNDSGNGRQTLHSSTTAGNSGTGNVSLQLEHQFENENCSNEPSQSNIPVNSSFKSSTNRCSDMESIATGSILGALLTSGGSRGNFPSAAPVKTSEVASQGSTIKTGSDKWDTLMREVVSLSSKAKEKTGDRELVPSNHFTVPSSSNVLKPMKELSNNFRFDRFGNKAVSEVYVLKYANGTTGTRIAKVFKAKATSITKEVGTERRKENSNTIGRKPILITATVGSSGETTNHGTA